MTIDLQGLVQPDRVHKRVYTDPAIFELEMDRVFGQAWIYVGHESQVPKPGDYFTTRLGREPVVMVRHTDGQVHVMFNRCPHKGARIVPDGSGSAGKFCAACTTAGPSNATAACCRCRCAAATNAPRST